MLEVRGDVVRIGIDAPRSVIRSTEAELLRELEDSNRTAASPSEGRPWHQLTQALKDQLHRGLTLRRTPIVPDVPHESAVPEGPGTFRIVVGAVTFG